MYVNGNVNGGERGRTGGEGHTFLVKKMRKTGGADGPVRGKGWQPVQPSALRVGEKQVCVRPGGGLGETALPVGTPALPTALRAKHALNAHPPATHRFTARPYTFTAERYTFTYTGKRGCRVRERERERERRKREAVHVHSAAVHVHVHGKTEPSCTGT